MRWPTCCADWPPTCTGTACRSSRAACGSSSCCCWSSSWCRSSLRRRIASADGLVTFQLAPSWPGGKVIMPLGPAGVLQLATHHTPVNLKLDFTLNDSVPSVSEAQALLSGLPGLRPDAVAAFYSFLESRIPWLLLLGALAGVLVANGGRRWLRRTLLHALYGVGLVALLTAAFVGVTLLTFDSTPAVQYQGLAKNLPRVVELVRRINADSGGDRERHRRFRARHPDRRRAARLGGPRPVGRRDAGARRERRARQRCRHDARLVAGKGPDGPLLVRPSGRRHNDAGHQAGGAALHAPVLERRPARADGGGKPRGRPRP